MIMKTKTYSIGFWVIALFILLCSSCTQKSKESENVAKIEYTLKSVHFWSDSVGIDPSVFFAAWERINKAIDSIGYPDAGYKVWLVQSDSPKDFRFMVEGNWPDQAIYDTIHKHQLYKNAINAERKSITGLKNVSYNRFILVK
jgi:hypothetical protein